MGILKDIVLCRVRAFNAIALAEFILTKLDQFFANKLINFVNGRAKLSSNALRFRIVDLKYIDTDDNIFFSVQTTKNQEYRLSLKDWICSCAVKAKFCKHLVTVADMVGVPLPLDCFVLSTPEVKRLIAYIATGKWHELRLFFSLSQLQPDDEELINEEHLAPIENMEADPPIPQGNRDVDSPDRTDLQNQKEKAKIMLQAAFEQQKQLIDTLESEGSLKVAINYFSKIASRKMANDHIFFMARCNSKAKHVGRKIGVLYPNRRVGTNGSTTKQPAGAKQLSKKGPGRPSHGRTLSQRVQYSQRC